MKTKRFILLILVLATVNVEAGVGLSQASQQNDQLEFEWFFCGIGPFQSHESYKVSDGTNLQVSMITFRTPAAARRSFANQLKTMTRVEERKDKLDERGKKIGEKVVAVIKYSDGTEKTLLLVLELNSLHSIEAASFRHI